MEASKFCDSRVDCPDGSDEGIECVLSACGADNGGCSQVCNEVPGGECWYKV